MYLSPSSNPKEFKLIRFPFEFPEKERKKKIRLENGDTCVRQLLIYMNCGFNASMAR